MIKHIIFITLILSTTFSIKNVKTSQQKFQQDEQTSQIKEFNLIQKNGHVYLPSFIQNAQTEIRLTNNSPSWVFIQQGQLCDQNCQTIQSQITCQKCKRQKISQDLISEAQKYSIQGQETIQLNLDIKSGKFNNSLTEKFIIAKKVTLPNEEAVKIMLNINDLQNFSLKQNEQNIFAVFGNSKPSDSIKLPITDFDGQTSITFNNKNKDNIKLPKSNVLFNLSSTTDLPFNLPKQAYDQLRLMIKFKYLQGKCKHKQEYFICKNQVLTQSFSVDFQISKDCSFRLNIQSIVKKVSENKYQMLFGVTKQNDIIINLAFLKYYQVFLRNGKLSELVKNQNYQIVNSLFKQDKQEKQLIIPEQQKKISQSNSDYSHGILFMIIIYGVIGILIVIVVKIKAAQSLVASSIDYMFGKIAGIFHRHKGYEPSKLAQQIDDSNSVSMGYNKNHGGQMFWEKNSVQGI